MCFACDRDKCRLDYEEKLRSELEQIRGRTDTEMDRLKTSTREMYERENRFDSFYCSMLIDSKSETIVGNFRD